MLTRYEITNIAFPNPSINELLLQREPPDRKPNIIRKTILNEKNRLNLYLPLNSPKYKREFGKRILYDNDKLLQKERKLEELRTKMNSFSHKPVIYKKKIKKDDKLGQIMLTIKDNRNKLQELEDRNQKSLEKLANINGGNAEKPFNLQYLIKKVRDIAKSVNINYKYNKIGDTKNKFEMANKYTKHAIENKKNSKPIDDFYTLEKSRDNLYLQKLILNTEYHNVMDRDKKMNNNEVIYKASNYEINNEEYDKVNEEKSKTIFNNSTPSKKDLFKKIYSLTSGNLSRNNSGIKKHLFDDNELIKDQKNFEKDLLERRNIKFYHRYKNCLNTLKKEKVKHINNRIFDKQSIDSIMKSRNDLEIDKLKYDYTKIGTIEAINKTAFSRKKMFIDLKEKKEKAINKVNNKINTAIFNHDIGKITSSNYNLEDYIKL